MILGDEKRQEVLDALQGALGNSAKAKIVVSAVEAVLPPMETNGDKNTKMEKSGSTTREELYNNIEKSARLNSTYVILVVLSTIVVANGQTGIGADNTTEITERRILVPHGLTQFVVNRRR